MEVSAYLKLFGPDTSLAFGGGRGTFGELLDGNTRCVKKRLVHATPSLEFKLLRPRRSSRIDGRTTAGKQNRLCGLDVTSFDSMEPFPSIRDVFGDLARTAAFSPGGR